MKVNLDARWFSSRDQERKEATAKLILNNGHMVELFKEILEHMEANVVAQQVKEPSDDASWAFKQAHQNGQVFAMRELLKLTKHLKG